jgi:hypothetical protein
MVFVYPPLSTLGCLNQSFWNLVWITADQQHNGALHQIPTISLCILMRVPSSFLGNGCVQTLPWRRIPIQKYKKNWTKKCGTCSIERNLVFFFPEILVYLAVSSRKHLCPSREAIILRLLRNQKLAHNVHKSTPMGPIPSQMNPTNTFKQSPSKTRLSVNLLSRAYLFQSTFCKYSHLFRNFIRPANLILLQTNKQTPWSESASKLYRLSGRCLSAKWLPTFCG